jgi:hypothetical protein
MGRVVLAVAAGAALGLFVAAVLGWAAAYVFPPSVLVDMNPALAKHLPMPMGEVVVQLIGWILGGFIGGYFATRTAELGAWPAWAAGAVMAIGVIVFAMLWPHPIWFVIVCAVAVAGAGFGAGWLGGRTVAETEHA